MRRVLPLKLVLASLLFAACVTINVYFPAAAAERAADQIIDQVTGSSGSAAPQGRQQSAPPQGASQAPATSLQRREGPDVVAWNAAAAVLRVAAARLLEALVPAAHAQANANIDISSPEIRAVTASMTARFDQLEAYFGSGAVGLTEDGLVEIRDVSAVPLAERATVKRLVAEDNKDRNTLYAEIARANGHPEWETDIRRIFARRWIERGAKPGWWYQQGGSWRQK